MTTKNLNISNGVDLNTSINIGIPTGAIISIGGNDYSTYTSQSIDSLGFCPCDGRSLNTYTYRNLHAIISNIYGGTAYSDGVTNIYGVSTTFNVPDLSTGTNGDPFFMIGAANSASTVGSKDTSSRSHTHAGTGYITTDSATLDHNHGIGVSINNSNMGSHGHNINGVYVNTNAPGNSAQKNDGGQSTAGNGHGHALPFPGAYVANDPSSHGHYGSGNAAGAGNTGHTHQITASANLSSANNLIPYTVGLFFIKL